MNPVRFFSFPGTGLATLKSFPECGITLATAGPMKLPGDKDNRARVLRSTGLDEKNVLSLRQIHSRIVHVASSSASCAGFPEGDGIISVNRQLVPSVTVADCMPIYLFDPLSGCFGVLHSGWKGTGIVRSALELAAEEWGARPSSFRVILGPHIRACCYTVDAERADYFTRAFGPSCVSLDPVREEEGNAWPWRLSLAEANRQICLSLGIPAEHITDVNECTSCNTDYGSCRREGSGFTHMLAFIRWH